MPSYLSFALAPAPTDDVFTSSYPTHPLPPPSRLPSLSFFSLVFSFSLALPPTVGGKKGPRGRVLGFFPHPASSLPRGLPIFFLFSPSFYFFFSFTLFHWGIEILIEMGDLLINCAVLIGEQAIYHGFYFKLFFFSFLICNSVYSLKTPAIRLL